MHNVVGRAAVLPVVLSYVGRRWYIVHRWRGIVDRRWRINPSLSNKWFEFDSIEAAVTDDLRANAIDAVYYDNGALTAIALRLSRRYTCECKYAEKN